MTWLWQIALKKAGGAALQAIVALLASPKVVEAISWLGEKGFKVEVTVDETVAAVSIFAGLEFLRNWLKVKAKVKFL